MRPVLLSLLVWSTSASAIYVRNDVPVANYNALGADARFAAAGYLGFLGFGAFCTGTLISSTTVLTAGHCVDSDHNGLADDLPAQLAFGTEANVPALTANVSSIIISPFWVSSAGSAQFDMALLTLTAPIVSVTPASLGYSVNPAGAQGFMIGYGNQGTGTSNGSPPGANNRLGAENIIDFVGTTLRTDFDSPAGNTNTYGSATPNALEGTTAPGDSGGPLYALIATNVYVVGVLNGGVNPYGTDSWYGDVSFYAKVNDASNRAFLASNGFAEVPEPATWLLTAAGAALFALRRPKRRP